MAGFPVKYLAGALALIVLAAGYRFATKQPNEDNRNYEVLFTKPDGWRELPHNPNTLLFMQHEKSKALLRCATTQIVSETNPEPDMDTENVVKRAVENARSSQPEWKTDLLDNFDTGKVHFKLFRKVRKEKTIIVAMTAKGNTTLLVSVSNTGDGGRDLAAGKFEDFLAFLKTFDMQETQKWITPEDK